VFAYCLFENPLKNLEKNMKVRNFVQIIAGIFVNQSETSRKNSKPTSKRKLGFETLEGRELLSANWTGSNFEDTDDYWQDNVSNSYYESNYSSNSDSSNMSFQSNSTTSTDTDTFPVAVYTLESESTFDGSTFHTIGSNSGNIGNISSTVTLRAVFNASSVSGWKYLLAHDVENHRGNELFLRIRDGNLQFGYWLGANTGNANILAQVAVEANRTYDAVGTYDGQDWKLYVNGVLQASTSDTNRNIGVNETHNGESFTPVWLLGGHGETNDRRQFVGTISEAEIYDVALTAAQVSELNGPIVNLTGPTGTPTYAELTQDQFDVTITRESGTTRSVDTTVDLDFKLTISGDASKDDFEIYDGTTLISGASDYTRWSTNGTVFSYKISAGNESVILTFKVVNNQAVENEEESLTITLTSATVTVNSAVKDLQLGTDVDTTVTIKNDFYSVKWQTITGTDANKTTLSADPNSGGQRVFPEKSTSDGVIENKFELVFELEAAATAATTLYYNILDPDNFIGLGYNESSATTWAGNDNYVTLDTTTSIGSVVIAEGQSSVALTFVLYPNGYTGSKLTGNTTTIVIDSVHAGDNFIVVVDTNKTKSDAAALGTTEATRYQEINQLTQTDLLTVWRTLNVELDVANWTGMPDGDTKAPIDGLVASELARACIVAKEYEDNNTLAPDVGSDGVSETERTTINGSGVSSGRDISGNSNDFWTVRIVTIPYYNSQASYNLAYSLGTFQPSRNTVTICYEKISTDVESWNTAHNNMTVDFSTYLSSVVLHEIAHVLIDGIEEPIEVNLDGTPVDNTVDLSTKGVRSSLNLSTGGLHFYMEAQPSHLEFKLNDLKDIQFHSRARN
jgi:hypothetical protein